MIPPLLLDVKPGQKVSSFGAQIESQSDMIVV